MGSLKHNHHCFHGKGETKCVNSLSLTQCLLTTKERHILSIVEGLFAVPKLAVTFISLDRKPSGEAGAAWCCVLLSVMN